MYRNSPYCYMLYRPHLSPVQKKGYFGLCMSLSQLQRWWPQRIKGSGFYSIALAMVDASEKNSNDLLGI